MLVCCFVTSCYNKLTINSKVGADTQNSLTHSSENIKLSLLDHIFNFRTRLDSTPSSSNVSFAVTSLINRKLICCVLQVWIMQICSISKKKAPIRATISSFWTFFLRASILRAFILICLKHRKQLTLSDEKSKSKQ